MALRQVIRQTSPHQSVRLSRTDLSVLIRVYLTASLNSSSCLSRFARLWLTTDLKGLANVLVFQFRKLAEALGPIGIKSCDFDSPTNGKTGAPNARLPVHLRRINSNPVESLHVFNYLRKSPSASRSLSLPSAMPLAVAFGPSPASRPPVLRGQRLAATRHFLPSTSHGGLAVYPC